SVEVSLAVPPDSIDFWERRLTRYGTTIEPREQRFGHRALPLIDPHGLRVALVESASALTRDFTPWTGSPVPIERQIRGWDGARLLERDVTLTASFLTTVLGFAALGTEGSWQRYGVNGGPAGASVDIQAAPS